VKQFNNLYLNKRRRKQRKKTNRQNTMIAECLKIGKENATSSEGLCISLGFRTKRELVKKISQERQQGAVICSSVEGGYYLPKDKQEIQEFIRTLESRGRHTLAALKSARKELRKMDGQQEIEL